MASGGIGRSKFVIKAKTVNIQQGAHNTQNITVQDSRGSDEHIISTVQGVFDMEKKNEIVMEKLQSMLMVKLSGMADGKQLSFKKLFGKSFLKFLRKNPEVFILEKKDKWYVKCKQSQEPADDSTSTDESEIGVQDGDELEYLAENTSDSKEPEYLPENMSDSKEPEEMLKGLGMQKAEPSIVLPTKCAELLLKSVGYFKNGHYILVVDERDNSSSYLQTLSLVPWTAVLDMDNKSRDIGLLSVIEEPLKRKRAVHLCSWQDTITPTDGATNWISLQGRREKPETRIPEEYREWYRCVKKNLSCQIDQLSKFADGYTTYKVLVFWPKDSFFVQHIETVIREIEDTVEPAPQIVIVDSCYPKNENSARSFQTIKDYYGENLTVVNCTIKEACDSILTVFTEKATSCRFELPTMDRTNNPGISESDASWLKVDLNIIYKSETEAARKTTFEDLQREKENFYRGGTLPWKIWYEQKAGFLDAERDLMKDIEDSLQKKIDECKSGRVTLHHSPGSGGTTLAHRILFDLKDKTPCGQVKLRTGSPILDVASRINMIYEKTRLPVLLLIDGEEEHRVDQLERATREICIIFLYVRRNLDSLKKYRRKDDEFRLFGHVSPKEAKHFSMKYMSECKNTDQRQEIQRICREVEAGKEHYVYEFGLAVYAHEYKGIESYVHGFLFPEQYTQTNSSWQAVTAFVAMAYYYGNMGMPCQLLGRLMGRHPNENMTLARFPDAMRQFLTEDDREGKVNVVRICHYVIAKEILDQYLSYPKQRQDQRDRRNLCDQAKSKLCDFAMHFVDVVCKGKIKTGSTSSTIRNIFTQTFIVRDLIGYQEAQQKGKVSKILFDMDNQKPYTKRFRFVEKLASSCPEEPLFQSHLGRLYSIFKPEEEQKAENCFKLALSLSNKEIERKGLSLEDIDDGLRLSLMQIHHMYGSMYRRRIAQYTGWKFGDKPKMSTPDEQTFKSRVKQLLEQAKQACHHFEKCREVTPPGNEDTYKYIGDINVRLQVCDYIYRHTDGTITDAEMKAFFEECVSVIDDLFLECHYVVDPDNFGNTLRDCTHWYTDIFKSYATSLSDIPEAHAPQSKRTRIASIKLQYNRRSDFGVLEFISSSSHVKEIVDTYEEIFKNWQESEQTCIKRTLDLDYREWLIAIRLPLFFKSYSLEDVLQIVRQWCSLRTPNAKFYLFILTSLLGFHRGNPSLLMEAIETKEEVKRFSRMVLKPKYPREWLGKGDDIKCLVPGYRFFGQIEERSIRRDLLQSLKVMNGTICKPNDNHLAGYIDLDLGNENRIPIKVFFIPARSKLIGRQFSDQRVTFVIGFSMSHGYEAFNVKTMKKS
ncbi:hypothetical protein CHS0354_023480 [Potamilus streckersoni]|uniref:Sterile alpha motif domain-containing protein 9-like n=1 Tax=Potamilus streckersoni TaxID=2493646 RepID=A0AAE0S3Z8_9BIVA|nr:hypothetical protein CHS0354_023480 [Potamilus streckersoni]